ncbi:hypothetical protein [Rhizobacter sp. Root404]|uniref:hypothetical protein n=1 Tax=Rhizobacter sp. Root404 TaxID=1736528 RepID=UPI0012FA045E|nr:hypothetical protein [Rhizobacter sp. Root404]
MSKTLVNAASTARDLCRDAFGNGRSGQDERSLRYVALAIEQLEGLLGVLENRSDTVKSIALENLTRSLRTDTHPAYRAFPKFDPALLEAANDRWKSCDLPDVLPVVAESVMPPTLKAALAARKSGEPVMVSMPLDEARAMFAG